MKNGVIFDPNSMMITLSFPCLHTPKSYLVVYEQPTQSLNLTAPGSYFLYSIPNPYLNLLTERILLLLALSLLLLFIPSRRLQPALQFRLRLLLLLRFGLTL